MAVLWHYCKQRKEGFAKPKVQHSQCFFVKLNYKKNCGTKKQVRLNTSNSSTIPLTPPFANTMLAEVSFYRLIPRFSFPPSPISTIFCSVESLTSLILFSTFEI